MSFLVVSSDVILGGTGGGTQINDDEELLYVSPPPLLLSHSGPEPATLRREQAICSTRLVLRVIPRLRIVASLSVAVCCTTLILLRF